MALAVEEGKKSETESGRSRPAPVVGVVAVSADGELLGSSHRGATGSGDHAEFGLLEKIMPGADLTGARVFTTLEPCSKRSTGKTPCAQRLIDRGVEKVYIGMYDPFPTIYRLGWKMLTEAGIIVQDFLPEHRREVQHDNREFAEALALTVGTEGSASFDYLLNDKCHVVNADGIEFVTRWSTASATSIHGYAYGPWMEVAKARHATSFDQVDDPRALDFSGHSIQLQVGEIGVWSRDGAFLLVKVEKVHAGPERGSDHYELEISFQARLPEV
jgi:pyrimidine deaminase RibD-like protein